MTEDQLRQLNVDHAIIAIHALAAAEVQYVSKLNAPGKRGIKGAEKRMAYVRVELFRLLVGRKPTVEEREQLVWGDA